MTVYEYGMGGADDAGFEQPMTFRIACERNPATNRLENGRSTRHCRHRRASTSTSRLLSLLLGFSGPWLAAMLVCGFAFGGFFGALVA